MRWENLHEWFIRRQNTFQKRNDNIIEFVLGMMMIPGINVLFGIAIVLAYYETRKKIRN